ncbi:MAG TPA: hypothetical protein VK943_14650 [Arenibaculum sp.]|nr:hypothetical protein [Arenibaculum sp.]
MLKTSKIKWLRKKTRKVFRGYPVATLAYYGPDDSKATKAAVGIVLEEGSEPAYLRRWYSEGTDVRLDEKIIGEIVEFIGSHDVRTVTSIGRIIGCPHEEGIHYEGPTCPECPFWAGRDRWTGEPIR